MKIKQKRAFWILGSLLLSASVVSAILVSNSNNISQLKQNNLINSTKNQDIQNIDNMDFVLNDARAITLNQPSKIATSTSVVNGPRGFLLDINNKITYLGYDGKEIWASNISTNGSDQLLLASYYNSKASAFVVLHSTSDNILKVSSINETNGTVITLSEDYNTTNVLTHHLLVPIYNMSNKNDVDSYLIVPQDRSINNQKQVMVINIDPSANLTIKEQFNLNDNQEEIILSAGSLNYNGSIYYFYLSHNVDKNIYLHVFENNTLRQSLNVYNDWSDLNNTLIDNNIQEIWLELNTTTPIINVGAVLNAEKLKTTIVGGWYDINSNTLNNFVGLNSRSINLQQENILDYDIYKGRFYGNYLYAFSDFASWEPDGGYTRYIKLNVSGQDQANWSTEGLRWNNDYSNSRIVLYEVAFRDNVAFDPNFAITQPFYNTIYDGTQNIFGIINNQSDLWLIDGNKSALLYNTWNKSNSDIFMINNVSDTYVKDANVDLKTYFSQQMLENSFSQYTENSTYTVVKKDSPEALLQNYQGNIPVTLTIDVAFDNESYWVTPRYFDLVLSGFKATSTTINNNPSVALPANFASILAQDMKPWNNNPNVLDLELRKYLFDNVINDPSMSLNESDIKDIIIESFDNATGSLTFKIILSKSYNNDGSLNANETEFGPITLIGFKKAFSTILNQPLFTINGYEDINVTDITDSWLLNWLTTNSNYNQVFSNLPDDFETNNVVSINIINNSVEVSTGTLKANIVINNYYDSDAIVSKRNNDSIPFELTIKGFHTTSQETSVNTNPTAALSDELKQLLAQDITINTNGFKQYLFDNVLNDSTKKLTIDDITSISDITINNLTGEMKFKLTISKWFNASGDEQNTPQTFQSFITINGFKTVKPTSLINNASITQNKPDVWANDVLANEYTQIVKDNYKDVIANLPADFTTSNITNVIKSNVDNDQGILYVDVTIDNYYDENGVRLNNLKTFNNIAIIGYKTAIVVNINSQVDISLYDVSLANQVASSVISVNNTALATTWLQSDKIFKSIILNTINLPSSDFSVNSINNINNLAGTVNVTIDVKDAKLSTKSLTFIGFKKPTPINTWISTLSIAGDGTTSEQKIAEIKAQILNLANNNNSPFLSSLSEININVIVDANDPNKFIVTLVGNISYVDNNGNIQNTPIVPFTVEYKTRPINRVSESNSYWIFYIVFPIAAAILLLVTILLIIFKTRYKKYIK